MGLFSRKDKVKFESFPDDTNSLDKLALDTSITPVEEKKEELLPEIDDSKLQSYFKECLDHYTKVETQILSNVQRGSVTKEEFLDLTVQIFKEELRVPDYYIEPLINLTKKYFFGYYILEDLINDPTISDIKVLYPRIRIKQKGQRKTTALKFRDKEDYRSFVEMIALRNKTNLSDINAIQNFTDKTTNEKFILRFNITTPYVNSIDTAYLHIRKIPKDKNGITELVEAGMLNWKTANYLIEKAKTAKGIIFTGKGASGKTTLMNALLEHIPHTKSASVIQENEELFSNVHPDMEFHHVVTSRGEGKTQYDLQTLARNGLLTDLDYFIIGEIKGGEALYFLNAVYTGHQGWCSVHGSDSIEAMNKLADYVKYASDYSRTDVLRMLSSVELVIFLKDFKVQEINEISGWDEVRKELYQMKIFTHTLEC